MMDAGIYAIRNKQNGKLYIGSAKSIVDRFNSHKKALHKGNHHNVKLQNAFNKYGFDNFGFEKLLICKYDDLIMYEQLCINGYDAVKNGYNIAPIAGNTLGCRFSDETKAKMSASRKGKKRDRDAVDKTAAAHTGMKRSAESCERMRVSQIKRWTESPPDVIDDMKNQVSKVHKGKKITPEHIELLAGINRNRVISDEEKEMRSNATKKMWASLTQEQRDKRNANMSKALKDKFSITPSKHIGMKRSDEARENMSKAQIESAARRKAAKLAEGSA